MITRIEALNFRCLRYVAQDIGPFHVLVGPNASGKTTFLDVIAFLGRLIADGPEAAVRERTRDFRDLVTGRVDGQIEFAVEAKLPERMLPKLGPDAYEYNAVRYEIALGLNENGDAVHILKERLRVTRASTVTDQEQRELFPASFAAPATLFRADPDRTRQGTRTLIVSKGERSDNFTPEPRGAGEHGKAFMHSFRLGPRKSALGNLPEDEERFPAATWFKSLLAAGVQQFILNSLELRRASPPQLGSGLRTDGSNLPWVIERLRAQHPERFAMWVDHVRTALPDVRTIETVEREDDRHRYLLVNYDGGLRAPAWMVSDGTLRLLALTLPAYVPDFQGIYLIEEPENGIHPRAVETVLQSLSSVYDAQVLVASHSPMVLGQVEPEQILCFAKTPKGETDIVLGAKHPALRAWKGSPNLSVLYAGGVLG
jgi:predicted ATPase